MVHGPFSRAAHGIMICLDKHLPWFLEVQVIRVAHEAPGEMNDIRTMAGPQMSIYHLPQAKPWAPCAEGLRETRVSPWPVFYKRNDSFWAISVLGVASDPATYRLASVGP